YKGDYDVCGIPFGQRWSRFNEALEMLYKLWNNPLSEKDNDNYYGYSYDTKHDNTLATDLVDYNDKYYKLDKVSFALKPHQKPHPPIYIGTWGSSEAGLKRVAKYGDGWMASA